LGGDARGGPRGVRRCVSHVAARISRVPHPTAGGGGVRDGGRDSGGVAGGGGDLGRPRAGDEPAADAGAAGRFGDGGGRVCALRP